MTEEQDLNLLCIPKETSTAREMNKKSRMESLNTWCINMSLGMYLDMTGSLNMEEYERRSLVRSLHKMNSEQVDTNILQNILRVWEEWESIWLSYYTGFMCSNCHEEDAGHLINPCYNYPSPKVMSDVSLESVSYRCVTTVDCKKHLLLFGKIFLVWLTQPLAGTYLLADPAQLNKVLNP